MNFLRSRALRLALVCALLAATVPLAAHATGARAGATIPCWKRLLNDWYDGTINKRYPLPCYQKAIDHLPTDLVVYGSAKDDILAARQAAQRGEVAPPEHNNPNTTAAASTTTTTTETITTNGTTTTATTVIVVPVQTTPPKKSGGIGGALDRLNPGNPDSFPLPLLILGALAILLVIAGAGGMLWQRSHPRDDGAEA